MTFYRKEWGRVNVKNINNIVIICIEISQLSGVYQSQIYFDVSTLHYSRYNIFISDQGYYESC